MSAVNVGIGAQDPQGRFQVAGGGSGYDGAYLQIPVVKSTLPPPAGDCNSTNLACRMVR